MSRSRHRYEYVLGDSRQEALRLRAQAALWDPSAHALFDRLNIRSGWRVLEIGPGLGSLNLELRRQVGGPVDIVERSPAFVAALERLWRRDGRGPGHVWATDLINARLPPRRYDLIFARWVFLFLPEPAAHLRKLVRALKPGGLIALEEYHRETWTLVPRPPEWEDFLSADRTFLGRHGGDASVGSRLATLYRKGGLDIVDVNPIVKTGAPGSPVWNWLRRYCDSVWTRYAEIPPLSPAKVERLRRAWRSAARDPTSRVIAPAMLEVVGRKRG